MEEEKLKEFYFREKNGEIFFFFREKKKSGISYETWKENCDKAEIKENDTLEKLLSFLGMNEKILYSLQNIFFYKKGIY